jgi:hypothetical protein
MTDLGPVDILKLDFSSDIKIDIIDEKISIILIICFIIIL